jgi:hypothetical protein
MTDLASLDAYELRFKENCRVTGYQEDSVVHFPCPFCAARDWWVTPAVEIGLHRMEPHYCVGCDRASYLVFPDEDGRRTAVLVQSSGPAPPEWMPVIPPSDAAAAVMAVSAGRLEMPGKKRPRLRTPPKTVTPKKNKLAKRRPA